MSTLYILIGLQGSGKSYWARWRAMNAINCLVVSSDAIRQKYNYEIDNNKVFDIFYEQINNGLMAGKDVIADATNTTIKARRQLFERVKVNCRKVGIWFNEPIEVCRKRLEERNKSGEQREVPLEALEKYHKGFQVPFYEEGFNLLWLINSRVFDDVAYKETKLRMDYFDQKNKYHDFSLGLHCDLVEHFLQSTGGFQLGVGSLHDIGKLFTQTIDEEGQAHYYNHENIGAYYLGSHTELMACQDPWELLFVVNYHMMPFGWQTEKALKKWTQIFGENKVKMLQEFNKYDQLASKKINLEKI